MASLAKLLVLLGLSTLVWGCGSEARRTGGDDDDATGSPTGQSTLSGGSYAGNCVDVCQEASQCQGVGEPPSTCANECEKLDDLAARSGCGGEIDAVLDCYDGLADVCDVTNGACQKQLEGYVDCFSAFCMASPNDEACGGA